MLRGTARYAAFLTDERVAIRKAFEKNKAETAALGRNMQALTASLRRMTAEIRTAGEANAARKAFPSKVSP